MIQISIACQVLVIRYHGQCFKASDVIVVSIVDD